MKHVPFVVVAVCITAVILYLLHVTNSDPAGHAMLVAWVSDVLNDGVKTLGVIVVVMFIMVGGFFFERLS